MIKVAILDDYQNIFENIIEVNNPTIMSESIQFEKPAEKGECKMVSSDNIDQLVNMLQNEAKVI